MSYQVEHIGQMARAGWGVDDIQVRTGWTYWDLEIAFERLEMPDHARIANSRQRRLAA